MFNKNREVRNRKFEGHLRPVYLAAPGPAAGGVHKGEEGAELVKHLDVSTALQWTADICNVLVTSASKKSIRRFVIRRRSLLGPSPG